MDMMDFKHLAVEFFTDAKLSKRKSAEAGRPVYEDIEKVRLRIAGDPKSVLVAPAHSASSVCDAVTNRRLTYAELHAGPYEAFKKGQKYVGSGTPLTELPFLTAAKRAELNALNVFTADALAELDGANLNRLGMGGRDLKNQAAEWLAKAQGSAGITQMAAENEALRNQMARLQEQMEVLMNSPAPEAPAEPVDTSGSPFADWDDDTIRLWIEEQGGDKPHHKAGHAKLVQIADELNAALQKKAA